MSATDDKEKRLHQLYQSVDKGNAAAQYALGLAHLYGKDVARDIGEALWLLHWAAKQGDVEAQTFLSDLNDRVKRLRRASGIHTGGQYHLGLADCAEHLEEDVIGALERLEQLHRAAKQGDVEAQTALGDLYHDDPTAQCVAGESSDDVAVKWYAKSARRGYAQAQFKLGTMYGLGEGVEQSDKRMLQWKVRAALNGSLEAQRNLCLLNHLGIGGLDDYAEALRWGWDRMAAEQGSVGAQCQLAQAYAMGIGGVSKNLAEALEWLLRAAEQGSSLAQYCLEKPSYPLCWQAELQEYRRRCQNVTRDRD